MRGKCRNLFRRAAALLLAAVMTALAGAQPALAAEEDERNEEYLQGLYERCEAYLSLEGDSSDGYLLDRDKFLYCIWADEIDRILARESYEIENADEKNFLEKVAEYLETAVHNAQADVKIAFTWAGHALTDTKLNEEAYIEYLSRIMAMQEKGFLETAWSQTEYSIRVNAWSEIKAIGKQTLSVALKKDKNNTEPSKIKLKISQILGKENTEKLEKIYKKASKGVKIANFANKEVKDLAEAAALGIYVSLHDEQQAFLQAILDYADEKEQKELYKAAQTMMEASDMRLAGLILADDGEVRDFSKIVSYMTNGDLDINKIVENITQQVSAGAKSLAAKMGTGIGASLLKGVGALASKATLIYAGFQIGGHVGRLMMGNDYERIREAIIMDDIGTALGAAFADYAGPAGSDKSSWGDRYDAIFCMVAAGEALCYARLMGEYSVLENQKGRGALPDEEIDRLYESKANNLNRCYQALASIFPEPAPVVSVYAPMEREKEQAGSNWVSLEMAVPTVYIDGNDDAAQKINEDAKLNELLDSTEALYEDTKSNSAEMGSTYWTNLESSVDLWMEDAFATDQALSMRFKRVSYYMGSAHPNHVIVCTNYDTSSGAYLNFEDILADDKEAAKEKFLELMGPALAEAYPEWANWTPGRVKNPEEIVKINFLDAAAETRERHWYFSDSGLNIVFDPYQIAPYAAGSITATVPYYQLEGVIREEYLARDLRGIQATGTPELVMWDELDRMDKTRFNGGNVYGRQDRSYKAVITDAAAYHAKVKKGYSVLFYSSCMMPSDAAWMNDMSEVDSPEGEVDEYLITSETNLTE